VLSIDMGLLDDDDGMVCVDPQPLCGGRDRTGDGEALAASFSAPVASPRCV
jgi:hypothetical protein